MKSLADFDLKACAVLGELHHARADFEKATTNATARGKAAALFDTRQALKQARENLDTLINAIPS